MAYDLSSVPIFLLCGGMGTRMKEETEYKPKPMVEVGGKPILLHIMHSYAAHGFRRFVLCLGFKSEYVKNYFLNKRYLDNDFVLGDEKEDPEVLLDGEKTGWKIYLVDTGDDSMTGCRVARAFDKYFSDEEHFGVTYGDGLSDVDLAAEFAFHLEHEKLGTIMGVNPVSRFGQIKSEDTLVTEFQEKPVLHDDWINGGYFFFRAGFRQYLKRDSSCVLETDPMRKMSEDRELHVFRHTGFWACMDTQRDKEELEDLFRKGKLGWLA